MKLVRVFHIIPPRKNRTVSSSQNGCHFKINDPHICVDGRNPAPPGMYKAYGKSYLSTGAGFLPSTVSHWVSPSSPFHPTRLCRHISTDQLLLRLIGHTAADILLERARLVMHVLNCLMIMTRNYTPCKIQSYPPKYSKHDKFAEKESGTYVARNFNYGQSFHASTCSQVFFLSMCKQIRGRLYLQTPQVLRRSSFLKPPKEENGRSDFVGPFP